jgi:hypothetical protein
MGAFSICLCFSASYALGGIMAAPISAVLMWRAVHLEVIVPINRQPGAHRIYGNSSLFLDGKLQAPPHDAERVANGYLHRIVPPARSGIVIDVDIGGAFNRKPDA